VVSEPTGTWDRLGNPRTAWHRRFAISNWAAIDGQPSEMCVQREVVVQWWG